MASEVEESGMADGKWVMTEADSKRVDLTFSGSGRPDMRGLPNYGQIGRAHV